MDLPLVPTATRAEILQIQSRRKRLAFERARTIPWYRGRLDHIDADRLDDPAVWSKIPILDKDTLRQFDHAGFLDQFCAVPREAIAEYWRSGGTTGKPVFYPRTAGDVRAALVSWGRAFPCMGIGHGDLAHIAFPIGIHPAGQVWARSAEMSGTGMVWAGAGNACPSDMQLGLIEALKPTVFMGMSSFCLHLANLAEARGLNLAASSVTKVICTAETLSMPKREKIGRMWGAEVFDVFGMSEAGLMGAETAAHDGIHVWTDLYFIEVVDPDSGEAVPAGEVGTLCVTPLWTNEATPFLRWNSGDLVQLVERSSGSGPWVDAFPMIRHANRTTGFFKIRGINVNHAEFEDMMFRQQTVNDFQAILETEAATGREALRILVEIKREVAADDVTQAVATMIKQTFEVTARIEVQPQGTLAAEFERTVKAARFVDRRE